MDALLTTLLGPLSPAGFAYAMAIGVLGGLVKGMVGFAMPTVLISGLTTVLAPDVALAALILPTLASNMLQALRYGARAAFDAVIKFRVFLLAGMVFMMLSAQLVTALPQNVLFLMIGVPVTGFALMQLIGWQPKLAGPSHRVALIAGSVTGFIGGFSGVWGPPTVAYLTAMDTPKAEQMRIQGVIYGLGAVILVVAHMQSGVLRAETVPLSLAMIAPAMLGMVIGLAIQDRIDQAQFRKVTLFVLIFAGLNLMRRGLM